MWGEMLDVLKDISTYLEKQDSEQRRADLDVPPKIQETQKPIKGGEMPGEYGPGKGIAKQLTVPQEPQENEDTDLAPKEGTLLKEADEEELEDEELEDEDSESIPSTEDEDDDSSSEPVDDIEELKSLLKDIKSALSKGQSTEISKSITTELQKSLPKLVQTEANKMLRKMGFTPTRPDIVRFGVDEDIKKSEDTTETKMKDVEKAVDDLSKKSFVELGQIREKLGHFRPF